MFEVENIKIDSRLIKTGDIFIDIANKDIAIANIMQALKLGAKQVFTDKKIFLNSIYNFPIAITLVSNIYAQIFTLMQYKMPNFKVAITGTNGKSSCVFYFAQICQALGQNSACVGTLGFQTFYANKQNCNANNNLKQDFNANLTTNDLLTNHKILKFAKLNNINIIAKEGSSHGIKQNRLRGIKFECLIIASISHDHLDYHASFEDYIATKLSLISPNYLSKHALILTTKKIFTNFIANNKTILNIIDKEKYQLIILQKDIFYEYTIDNYQASIVLSYKNNVKNNAENKVQNSAFNDTFKVQNSAFNDTFKVQNSAFNGSIFQAVPADFVEKKEIFLKTSIFAKFQVENFILSFLAANYICAKNNEINKNLITFQDAILVANKNYDLTSIKSPSGRMDTVPYKQGLVVVDYAHNADSLKLVLQELRLICVGKLIVVFGCGGDRDKAKRKDMGNVVANFANLIIITDDNPRFEDAKLIRKEIINGITENAKQNYFEIANRYDAIAKGLNLMQKNDILLVAGKGHENMQIIKNQKIHFNDLEVIKTLMQTLR